VTKKWEFAWRFDSSHALTNCVLETRYDCSALLLCSIRAECSFRVACFCFSLSLPYKRFQASPARRTYCHKSASGGPAAAAAALPPWNQGKPNHHGQLSICIHLSADQPHHSTAEGGSPVSRCFTWCSRQEPSLFPPGRKRALFKFLQEGIAPFPLHFPSGCKPSLALPPGLSFVFLALGLVGFEEWRRGCCSRWSASASGRSSGSPAPPPWARAPPPSPAARRWSWTRGPPLRPRTTTSSAPHWTGGRRRSATTAPAAGALPPSSTWSVQLHSTHHTLVASCQIFSVSVFDSTVGLILWYGLRITTRRPLTGISRKYLFFLFFSVGRHGSFFNLGALLDKNLEFDGLGSFIPLIPQTTQTTVL